MSIADSGTADLASVSGPSGAGAAPDLGTLLSGAGASGANPMASLQAQLAAQAKDNPGLGMLLQMLQQRAEPQPVQLEEASPKDDVPQVAEADVRELLRQCENMELELEDMRDRNDAIAAALGSCHLCFGESRRCPECRGRGTPGSRAPDASAFRRFVTPALHRVQRDKQLASTAKERAKEPAGSFEGLAS